MRGNILIFAEEESAIVRLASVGSQIATELQGSLLTALLGYEIKHLASSIARYVDEVLFVDDPSLKTFDASTYSNVLEQIISMKNVEVFLSDSTVRCRTLSAYLSAKLNAACITNVTQLEPKGLIAYHDAYGGLARATSIMSTPLKFVVMKSSILPEARPREKMGEITEFKATIPKPKTEVIHVKKKEVTARIDRAEIAIVAGRGFAKKEDLRLAHELADTIGGVVGVSRPLAADYGWAPIWVGMSGVSIKPKLYIGVGVSGDVPHVEGIKSSRIIVAINKDPNARIFKVSDYGIIGDLYSVLPTLTEEIKKMRK